MERDSYTVAVLNNMTSIAFPLKSDVIAVIIWETDEVFTHDYCFSVMSTANLTGAKQSACS
jgi:hypothetical protein